MRLLLPTLPSPLADIVWNKIWNPRQAELFVLGNFHFELGVRVRALSTSGWGRLVIFPLGCSCGRVPAFPGHPPYSRSTFCYVIACTK